MDVERIVAAIQWRLGLRPAGINAGRDWEAIEEWLLADHPRRSEVMAAKIAEPLTEIIRWGLLRDGAGNSLPSSWQDLKGYLEARRQLPKWMARKGASYIEHSFAGDRLDTAKTTSEQTQPAMAAIDKNDKLPATEPDSLPDESTIPTKSKTLELSSDDELVNPAAAKAIGFLPNSNAPVDPADTNSQNSNPSSQSTQWRYRPVPNGPDKHKESDQAAGVSPEGLPIIGARVRGKKHKHEGTNCDDWFEFVVSGLWTIIAVSDGAGSKIFSRIGAKDSCETAVRELSASLQQLELKVRDDWSGDQEEKKGIFAEEDLDVVRAALHRAMQKAYDAVAAKAQELIGSDDHKKVLGGREVILEDFSATLLLAVHTTVRHEDKERSFVMTCQIGDGMLAVVDGNGGLQLMGVADSGEFAGQTDFLTSKKKLEKPSLASRTFAFLGPLKALMVMTDGVADDYFPNDPGMLRLYGDLAINGIFKLRFDLGTEDESKLLNSSLEKTKLENTLGVRGANFASPVEAITANGATPIMIRSVETYARQLGLEINDVIKSTPLLVAGAMMIPGEDMCPDPRTNSEDMLRVWLDSYHVRGSFDDRTLVALYREVAS